MRRNSIFQKESMYQVIEKQQRRPKRAASIIFCKYRELIVIHGIYLSYDK